MLCFGDLAILAGAWERSREEFDDGLRVLCERLELRKQGYTRECRELGGRSAKVERIFLRKWGVDDSHLEGRIPETQGQASPTTGDARITKCDDLAIEAEEREEMERAIAAIANTIRDSPLTGGRTDDSASERDRYTAFDPLASAYWVEHTSTGFRHAIWRMENFNHVAPISIRALQFLGNITYAQVKDCRTQCPVIVAFGAQDPSCSLNAPGQMTTLPTGRRSRRRQKSDFDVFLHLKYTSRVMEPLSIRKMVNEIIARIVGDETATWLERTMIGWTYNTSIASRLCRPAEVFCDFDVAQWMEAYDPELCPCRSRRYADMRSPASLNLLQCEGHTHVITLDSSIMGNPLLQGIINFGLNHIPCIALDVDMAENEVGDFLDRLMARVLELRELTTSSQSFLRRVILRRARAKMSKYKEQHKYVSAEPFEHPAVNRELEFLTGRFLTCPTDKAPNTPAFVCKNFIRKLAFQRLSGPEFASIAAPPAAVVARIQGELSAFPALPMAPPALSYLMAVFKAHKGAFRWITNTAGTVISPAADLYACLPRFLLPLVQTFCQERSLEMQEQYGVRPNLWWSIALVGEFCANLPEIIFSVFTADITKCFETIPTNNSEDGLPAVVRFYVQSAMWVRRERSSCHIIQVRLGDGGKFRPSWVDADQAERMGMMLFKEQDVL
ncbi:hypothetical protein CBR_g23160 [Chara braunii]|uniref:Uncharacterized protein n=1 Tax=Chara braunii TaxID=69332 RepID=A0A388L3R3_CHABU|nr:hypothetical protein CBR_g23160 [Chara braunii]|eukprot:GBG76946.1 hypothetical protein CBR_g23160 [Chara braunii]